MIQLIKNIRKAKTSEQVLNYIEFIQTIGKAEGYKEALGLKNDIDLFQRLETIAFRIAVKKASTVEEIEQCAQCVEETYCGPLDPQQFAEEIRIHAYGIEWYMKQHINDYIQSLEYIQTILTQKQNGEKHG